MNVYLETWASEPLQVLQSVKRVEHLLSTAQTWYEEESEAKDA